MVWGIQIQIPLDGIPLPGEVGLGCIQADGKGLWVSLPENPGLGSHGLSRQNANGQFGQPKPNAKLLAAAKSLPKRK